MYKVFNLVSFVVNKNNYFTTMSGQTKIENFFKLFPKRKFSDDIENNDTTNVNKKSKFVSSKEASLTPDETKSEICVDIKLENVNKIDDEKGVIKMDEHTVNRTVSKSTTVSPDEIKATQESIAQKRLKAKIRLTSKQFPVLHENIGETWFKALEPEFKKPYFGKVPYVYLCFVCLVMFNACIDYLYIIKTYDPFFKISTTYKIFKSVHNIDTIYKFIGLCV